MREKERKKPRRSKPRGPEKGKRRNKPKKRKEKEKMEEIRQYRHENKYDITYAQYLALRQRLRTVMKPDPHARADGTYRIRSIYFDNLADKALMEKKEGVLYREKFRIRYYNDDFSHLTLEKKIKNRSLTRKESAPLSLEECERILNGDIAFLCTKRRWNSCKEKNHPKFRSRWTSHTPSSTARLMPLPEEASEDYTSLSVHQRTSETSC